MFLKRSETYRSTYWNPPTQSPDFTGYPLLLTLSTQQFSHIVCSDEEILRPKGNRLPADHEMSHREDPSDRREEIRQARSKFYLEDYSDENVVDPIKEFFPACTMPLSCTCPLTVSPAIMYNREYAQEYINNASFFGQGIAGSSTSTVT